MIEDDTLRYDKMVEGALRSVVRDAVQEVVENGLPGDHHFYITFLTEFPGVDIPDYLKDRYPGEMTIVLQFQFEDLYVDDEVLKVSLSFNNKPEILTVPLAAISIFADPSVNFALQFQPLDHDHDDLPDPDGDDSDDEDSASSSKGDDATGEVISLDQFRKK
ncbi:MAG: SspB family protein [Bdellovibrionales bacterium]